jgi:agmatine deiminase
MTASKEPTPAELGFRHPAEWEPHAATWLAWPHQEEDWPGKIGPIPWVYVEIIRKLARFERVRLLVNDTEEEVIARDALEQGGVPLDQVDFHVVPTDRVWLRDTAPSFVKRGSAQGAEIAVVDWEFNGWAKYANHELDNRIPEHIAKLRGLRTFVPHRPVAAATGAIATPSGGRVMVLEGGSIDVDGEGTLLTTEECLLSEVQQRNPGLSREQIERALGDHLGVQKVLWLGRGIAGDDTHGHVDDLCRFVRPGVVVVASESNRSDENYAPLAENFERLTAMTNARGQKLEVIKLPMPAPVVFDEQRLPASYANFYIANNQVLVPTFNDPNDRIALGILADLFPDREVVGIHAVDLVWGLGTLHCMSHEEPA